MLLSIIIPAYNEEKTINEIIERVKKQSIPSVTKEIIVVDDGSHDNTYEKISKIKGIKVYRHGQNKGKGRAIRTGLQYATGDFVIIQDADLELSPKDYPQLIEPLVKGKASVVYGSRLLGKKDENHSMYFYAGGRLVTEVANFLYNINITDEPIGYKAFKTSLLKSLNLECERFEFCPEVTAKIARRNIPIHEVPVSYTPRTIAEGKKVGIKDGIQAVYTLVKYKFKK